MSLASFLFLGDNVKEKEKDRGFICRKSCFVVSLVPMASLVPTDTPSNPSVFLAIFNSKVFARLAAEPAKNQKKIARSAAAKA